MDCDAASALHRHILFIFLIFLFSFWRFTVSTWLLSKIQAKLTKIHPNPQFHRDLLPPHTNWTDSIQGRAISTGAWSFQPLNLAAFPGASCAMAHDWVKQGHQMVSWPG